MPDAPNNLVRLVPGLIFTPSDVAEVRELHTLQAQLQVLKRIFNAEVAEFDRVRRAFNYQNSGLAGHAILLQIDRLEAGIAALADATQAHKREH